MFEHSMKPTLSKHRVRKTMPAAFIRMEFSAKNQPELVFNNLLHQLNPELLSQAFASLNPNKAKGKDGISKTRYGEELEENMGRLHRQLHNQSYQPSSARQVLIPKENGKMRGLAISNFEDKIVQKGVADILRVLYEPLFVSTSLGFRPKKGCHTALHQLYRNQQNHHLPYIVDIDIEKFFDTIDHEQLMSFLARRISDPRFLNLIRKLLKVGVLSQTGELIDNEIGSPQGSIVSPILANIYLHYVLDLWFSENFGKRGNRMTRYADDVIFCFRTKKNAEDFMDQVKLRLESYGLKLNEAKSKIVDFSKHKHETFHFLGFSFYWGKDRKQQLYLKLKTKAEKLRSSIQAFKNWIKENRNKKKLKVLWEEAKAKIRGHYAYYGVSHNKKLWAYHKICVQAFFKWINRRSQKHSMNWERFQRKLAHNPFPLPYGSTVLDITQREFAYD